MSAVVEEVRSEESIETIEDLILRVKAYYPQADADALLRAYRFSEKAHAGQIRRSGEPYITHPLGVAAILAELRLDEASIITGLLHDTVEDTQASLQDIERLFGNTVARLVDGVTKISLMKFRNTHEKQGENIRKMIVAMGKDVRVVLVKLADRLHNMRTMSHMPFDKQARISQETLDIYAPLASRLGISSVKVELEDLSFRYAHPERYYELVQKVAKKKKEREKYIDEVKAILRDEISKRSRFTFEVQGRPKHLYSIYRKMQSRNVDYDQIYDVLAFRVCVSSIAECYEVLGLVHSLWKPIPGRFKDFIAMPKANNYQSLHTTVVGPGGERIEIQIRTHEMNEVAEWGIAAHWKYKADSRGESSEDDDDSSVKFSWLRELVSIHQQAEDSDEFLENIKADLAESEIYVFTPKGDVKEFPEGATPVDFAYSIHTDIGHHVVAARVNGKLVPLKHHLQNGDSVEVITSKNQHPSKDWLKFCVTTRARSKIRAYVKIEQRKRAMELGREILDKAFRKYGHSLSKYMDQPQFERMLRELGCSMAEDLLIRVGYGKIIPQDVVDRLLPADEKTGASPAAEETSFIQKAFRSVVNRSKKEPSLIRVDGMDDVLVRFSKCCSPIPGDSIVGFITRGRGITIHRADCHKAYELDQARRIDVGWNDAKESRDAGRMVRLRVVSHDVQGLLKNMTEVFSSRGINIHNAQVRTTRDKKAICAFDVNIKDTQQLSQVMDAMQKIKGVIGVTRITHS